MSFPAARITDIHMCPLLVAGPVPPISGPVMSGQPNVLTGNIPAARVSDKAVCMGAPDPIVKGSLSVFIGGMPAARVTDMTGHGGIVLSGLPTVLIGDQVGALAGRGAPPENAPPLSPPVVPSGMSQQARTLLAACTGAKPFCEKCRQ